MAGLSYYVLDCETTGLKADYHEIFELSVIRVKDKAQLTKEIACRYPKRASFDALRVTKKNMNDLYKGISKERAVAAFNSMFEQDNNNPDGRVIIGHNCSFDRRHAFSLWKSVGKIFPANLWLDSLQMMRAHSKAQNWGKVSLALGNACDIMGVKKFAAHTAKGDTRRTFLLYQKIIEDLGMDVLPYIKKFEHNIAPPKDVSKDNSKNEDMSVLDGIDF